MKEEAQALHRLGRLDEAEKKYREVLAGFKNLTSPIHEDTMTVAYQLAELYAQLDRMIDADHVLDRLNRMSVEQLGFQHAKTRQHFYRVAELYQRWLRTEDAEVMLYRVFDAAGTTSPDFSTDFINLSTSTLPPIRNFVVDVTQDGGTRRREATNNANAHNGSSRDTFLLDEQSGLENMGTRSEPSALDLLLNSIKQYETSLERNGERLLRTHCAIVDLYERLNRPSDVQAALKHAEQSFWATIDLEVLRKESYLETCIEVTRLHIKWKQSQVADNLLEKVSRVAEVIFGADEHRVIPLLVRIGKMCWIEQSWEDAQNWFEQAYSISCSIYGLRHKLTGRLEKALEDKSWPHPLSDIDRY